MVDHGLEAGYPHEAAELTTRIEETDAGRAVAVVKIAESDKGDRQEEEAKSKATQQDGCHHVVGAALAGRAGQHPHRRHDHQDAKRDCGDGRGAADLHEESGHEERADEKRAAW